MSTVPDWTSGRYDRRILLNGIFWILCTGAPWRDLPERFGPWQTVYDHFRKRRKSGVFAAIIESLQVKLDKDGYIDWELWCVDGSSVRASRRTRRSRVGPQPRRVWIEVPRGH